MAIAKNSKVGFKAGSQEQINQIIKDGISVVDGYFYLTTDTRRLYIGIEGQLHLVGGASFYEQPAGAAGIYKVLYLDEDGNLKYFKDGWHEINSKDKITDAFFDAEYIEDDRSINLTPKFILDGDMETPIVGKPLKLVAKNGLNFDISDDGIISFVGLTGDAIYTELDEKIKAVKDSVQEYNNSIDSIQSAVDNLERDLNALTGADESLTGKIGSLEDTVSSLGETIQSLQVNIDSKVGEETIQGLQDSINELNSEISTNNNNISNLQNTVTTHGASIVTIDSNISELKNSVTDINNAVGDLQDIAKTQSDDIESLQNAVKNHETSIGNIENNVTGIQNSITSIESNVSTLSNKSYTSSTLDVEDNTENNSVSFNLNWIVHPAAGQE